MNDEQTDNIPARRAIVEGMRPESGRDSPTNAIERRQADRALDTNDIDSNSWQCLTENLILFNDRTLHVTMTIHDCNRRISIVQCLDWWDIRRNRQCPMESYIAIEAANKMFDEKKTVGWNERVSASVDQWSPNELAPLSVDDANCRRLSPSASHCRRLSSSVAHCRRSQRAKSSDVSALLDAPF